jgi:DNA-binding NarL/FixJ family response regulator
VIRVLIADDQALIRGGLKMILDAEPDLDVVGEAEDGHQALALIRELRPDVVLMDVRMPDLDGIATTTWALREPEPPRVLMLTTFDRNEYVYDALKAGASGFLLKSAPPDRVVDAVRIVASGESLLAPEITRRLIEEYVARPAASGAPPGLTEREVDVLRELAVGRSNGEIAASLFLSEATVKTYVARIFQKLGLRDRAQAVVYAYETGLIQPSGRPIENQQR